MLDNLARVADDTPLYADDAAYPAASVKAAALPSVETAQLQAQRLIGWCDGQMYLRPTKVLEVQGDPISVLARVAQKLPEMTEMGPDSYDALLARLTETVSDFTAAMTSGFLGCTISYQDSAEHLTETVNDGETRQFVAFTTDGHMVDSGIQGRDRHLTLGGGGYKVDDMAQFQGSLNDRRHIMVELHAKGARDDVDVSNTFLSHDLLAPLMQQLMAEPATLRQMAAEVAQQERYAPVNDVGSTTTATYVSEPVTQALSAMAQSGTIPAPLVEALVPQVQTQTATQQATQTVAPTSQIIPAQMRAPETIAPTLVQPAQTLSAQPEIRSMEVMPVVVQAPVQAAPIQQPIQAEIIQPDIKQAEPKPVQPQQQTPVQVVQSTVAEPVKPTQQIEQPNIVPPVKPAAPEVIIATPVIAPTAPIVTAQVEQPKPVQTTAANQPEQAFTSPSQATRIENTVIAAAPVASAQAAQPTQSEPVKNEARQAEAVAKSTEISAPVTQSMASQAPVQEAPRVQIIETRQEQPVIVQQNPVIPNVVPFIPPMQETRQQPVITPQPTAPLEIPRNEMPAHPVRQPLEIPRYTQHQEPINDPRPTRHADPIQPAWGQRPVQPIYTPPTPSMWGNNGSSSSFGTQQQQAAITKPTTQAFGKCAVCHNGGNCGACTAAAKGAFSFDPGDAAAYRANRGSRMSSMSPS